MSNVACESCSTTFDYKTPLCMNCAQVLDFQFINPFELFTLPIALDYDAQTLDKKYFEFQRMLHPDKMLNASEDQRQRAEQHIHQINEAYRNLGSSLSRSKAAILALMNSDAAVSDFERVVTLPSPKPEFLQQILEWMSRSQSEEVTDAYAKSRHHLATAIAERNLQDALQYLSELTYLDRISLGERNN